MTTKDKTARRRIVLDEREAEFVAEAIRLAPTMVLNTTRPAFEESDAEELAVRIERAGEAGEGVRFTIGHVLNSLNDAARDLDARAKDLRAFAELVKAEDPQTLVAPGSSFLANLMRAYDDAERSDRVKQSRRTALNMLTTAMGV